MYTKRKDLGYWEEVFYLDGEGNRVSDGWYYRDYMAEWAGFDYDGNTEVLGGDLGKVFEGGTKIKAGTWLYAPQGHPFDFVSINSPFELLR